MSYRESEDVRERYGATAQSRRSAVRRAVVDGFISGERARCNAQIDESGNAIDVEAEQFLAPGLMARPSGDAIAEAIVGQVGNSPDHVVVLGILDHGRFVVLDAEPLGLDETVVYNSSVRVRLVGDEIRASSIGNDGASLAFLSDAQSIDSRLDDVQNKLNDLVAAFNAHVHYTPPDPGMGGVLGSLPYDLGPPIVPVTADDSTATATIDGTTVLRAE